MPRLFLTAITIFQVVILFAQTSRSFEKAGDAAFKAHDYSTAMLHYSQVLQKRPENYDVWWKYAESARLFPAYDEAEKSFLRIAAAAGADYPLLNLRLAEVNQGQGDYTAALNYLDKFSEITVAAAQAEKATAERLKSDCLWAQEQLKQPARVKMSALGKSINSPYSDFAPFIKGDTLFFSSYRFDQRGGKSQPKTKITRLMWSIRGSTAREIGRGYPGGDSTHVAHTAFSRDGQFLFFTNCKNTGPNDIRCSIYLVVRDVRGRWGKPQALPAPVNLPGYTATQPSIGFDSLTLTPVLWFSSDRPGGKGGLDIWSVPLDTEYFCPCLRPLPGKNFSVPKMPEPANAAFVNTSGNEITPFFSEQQQKLYFSSTGYPGFGGYDVFEARLKQAGSYDILNLGPGINTSYNDVYFVLRPDGRRGMLSSNRPGALYLDERNKACCNDLFEFEFPAPEPTPPAQTDSLPPIPTPPPSIGQAAPVPLPKVVQLQDFVGLPLFFDNDEPDKRTDKTTTKKNYEETVLAYLERQEEYRQRFAGNLQGRAREQAEALIDAFFDNEVRAGYERLDELCALTLQHLQNGEAVEIQMKGYTSPRAQSVYNLHLGNRRVSSVRNYFNVYEQGVFQSYLGSGQLKITEISYGETQVKRGVSDRLEDERNSIYHPDAARERRVEIVGIKSGSK